MKTSSPIQVGAVVFDGFELLDLFGPLEMFGLLEGGAKIAVVAEKPDDTYAALPATVAVAWFNHAANSGPRFQRVVEAGPKPVTTGIGDSYREVEGAYFRGDKTTTLILQNTGASARTFDPTDDGQRSLPCEVAALVTPEVGDFAHRPADVQRIEPAKTIRIPARSIVRLVWDS